jgi:hypothetical protein
MTDTTYADPFAGEADEETRALAPMEVSFDPDESKIMFCSIDGDTRAKQILIYNIVAGSTQSLGDMVGTKIEVQDVIAHSVRLTSQETGEIQELIRTILVSPDGSAYSAVSFGVANCLKKLMKIVGPPPWSPPLVLVPRQTRTSSNRQILLLEAIEDGEA